MHELSICQALLGQVCEIARAHDADRVERIVVAIGPLSGVEPSLLADAFHVARAGGCAAAAELAVESAPLRVRCNQCGAESTCAPNRLLCAACGDYRTRLLSGDELCLLRVELAASHGDRPAPASLN